MNRTVMYFVYAMSISIILLVLVGMGRIDPVAGLPVVSIIAGHMFGRSDMFKDKTEGGNNGGL